MTFYHIQISLKERKPPYSIRESAFDLSAKELEERFLEPYRQGRSIVTRGRTISLNEIHRIGVYESKREVGNLGEIPWNIMKEVTNEFITSPAGREGELASRPGQDIREVFVVHGRNNTARDALFEFLRSIDLHPLEWAEAVEATGKASPYIGEILDLAFSRAHAVLVLFTPDDEARLRMSFQDVEDPPHETQLTGQARPNVLFEAGMAMAHNQDRTIMVELGTLRPFSDIGGRHVIRLDNSSQRRQELAQRLRTAGCPVKLEGTDWHTKGDFESALAPLVENTHELATSPEQEIPKGIEILALSNDAKELLLEATQDPSATIIMSRGMGVKEIQTNGKLFGERGNRRSEARWEQAIRDLQSLGLVEDKVGADQIFEVTHSGFEFAKNLATPK